MSSYKDERVNKQMKEGHKGYQDYAEAWKVFKEANEGYFPVYASEVGNPGILTIICLRRVLRRKLIRIRSEKY